MARMLKNTVFKTAGYAFGLPVGSNTVGPTYPTAGQTRWNTDTQRFEYYTGSIWHAVAHEGNCAIVADTFTGNANIATYSPMTLEYTTGEEAQILVFNGTVPQVPGTNYTVNGNAITFLGSVSDGATILIFHNYASTTAV